jgi:hypothetical protein
MSKAERRKRQRARARERQQGMRALEEKVVDAVASGELTAEGAIDGAPEVASAPGFSGGRFDPVPAATVAVDLDSSYPYITGPVTPQAPSAPAILGQIGMPPVEGAQPRRAGATQANAAEPVEPEEEDEEGDEYEDEEDDEDDEDDDEEEDEEGEESENAIDALFELACAAVEQGNDLDWPEVVSWLCSAELQDPRLAFVLSLIAAKEPGEGQTSVTLDISGDKVLELLGVIELGELVAEARETVAQQVKEAEELEKQSSKTVREKAKAKRGQEGGVDRPSAAQELGISPRKASEVAARSAAKAAVKAGVTVTVEEEEV